MTASNQNGVFVKRDAQNRIIEKYWDFREGVAEEFVEGDPDIFVPLTWDDIRSKRNTLLKESDFAEYSRRLTPDKKTAWLAYRDELFDLPETFNDPNEVIWPEKPE